MQTKNIFACAAVIIPSLIVSCSTEREPEEQPSGEGGMGAGGADGGSVSGDGDGDGDGAPGGGGMGGRAGLDCETDCADDSNPCTDDICNSETGECGIPRTGNSCDDGIYCNGADACDAGECTAHAGDPCEETSCNEGKDSCECTQVEHCPGEARGDDLWGELGEYGECQFDGECDEQGVAARTQILYSCTGGECVGTTTSPIDEPMKCARDLSKALCTTDDGLSGSCADGDCNGCYAYGVSHYEEDCTCDGEPGTFRIAPWDRTMVYCAQ